MYMYTYIYIYNIYNIYIYLYIYMYVYISSRVRGRTLVFATRKLPVAAQPAQGVEFRVYVSVWGLRFETAGDTLSSPGLCLLLVPMGFCVKDVSRQPSSDSACSGLGVEGFKECSYRTLIDLCIIQR